MLSLNVLITAESIVSKSKLLCWFIFIKSLSKVLNLFSPYLVPNKEKRKLPLATISSFNKTRSSSSSAFSIPLSISFFKEACFNSRFILSSLLIPARNHLLVDSELTFLSLRYASKAMLIIGHRSDFICVT